MANKCVLLWIDRFRVREWVRDIYNYLYYSCAITTTSTTSTNTNTLLDISGISCLHSMTSARTRLFLAYFERTNFRIWNTRKVESVSSGRIKFYIMQAREVASIVITGTKY